MFVWQLIAEPKYLDAENTPRLHNFSISQLDQDGFYKMTKHVQEPKNDLRHKLLSKGTKR